MLALRFSPARPQHERINAGALMPRWLLCAAPATTKAAAVAAAPSNVVNLQRSSFFFFWLQGKKGCAKSTEKQTQSKPGPMTKLSLIHVRSSRALLRVQANHFSPGPSFVCQLGSCTWILPSLRQAEPEASPSDTRSRTLRRNQRLHLRHQILDALSVWGPFHGGGEPF